MVRQWEVRWEGELPARPQDVWDAITQHADGYLWKIEYEPRVGGAERGLTAGGGTVTAWDPPRHFATRTRPESERDGFNELDYVLEPLGAATYLRYTHRCEMPAEDFDRQLDACRQHTTFYQHSLGQYACYFAGREPVYVSVDGPASSAEGGFAALRRALGLADDVVAGDPVRAAARGPRPDRRRRRLRDGRVPRRAHAPTRSCASTGATAGAGRWASRTTCSRRARTRRRPSGRGATGSPACSRTRGWRDGAVRGDDLRARGAGGPPARGHAGPHGPAGADRRAGRAGRGGAGPRAARTRRPRIRGDAITDGPFIETKEILGGVYVLEARDLDHALALARMTPIVDGGVEVRPLVGFQIVEDD